MQPPDYVTAYDLLAAEGGGGDALNRLAEALSPQSAEVDGAAIHWMLSLGRGPNPHWSVQKRAAAQAAHAVAVKKLANANAEAHAYIAPRYGALAPADAPPGLKVYVLDIAKYRIYGGDSDSAEARAYRAALDYLKSVAAGRIDLALPPAAAAPARPVATVSQPPSAFGGAGLAGY